MGFLISVFYGRCGVAKIHSLGGVEVECMRSSFPPRFTSEETFYQPVTKFYTFMVEDWPGEQCITLRRKFGKDECVKIEAMMIDGAITVPKANDENLGEDVRLHVSVLVAYGRVKVLSSWSSFVRPGQILQKFRKFTYSQATVLKLSHIGCPMLRI